MNKSVLESDARVNRQQDSPDIESLPSDLDSMGSKLVYLHLHYTSGGTVQELCHTLNIPTISIYPILNTLREEGLVERKGSQYVCTPT
jgi:DNA-binding MarR family transcriptional regulator